MPRQPDLFAVMLKVLIGAIIVYVTMQELIVPAVGDVIRLVQAAIGG